MYPEPTGSVDRFGIRDALCFYSECLRRKIRRQVCYHVRHLINACDLYLHHIHPLPEQIGQAEFFDMGISRKSILAKLTL